MPLVLVLWLAATLATFAAAWLAPASLTPLAPAAVGATLAAVACARPGAGGARAALAWLAAGGAAAATLGARDAHARCRAAAVASGALVVVLQEAAHADAPPARARTADRCALPVSVHLRAGSAPAGTRAAVRGLVLPTARGLRVRDGTLAPLARAGDPRARWRARTGTTIDRLFGRDAPLVRALVLAEADAIPPAVRDRYADAGLVHALSVSGLHVAIVAGALTLLLRATRAPPTLATLGAVAAVAAYVAAIGAPAPAVRAAVMLAADAVARTLQRPTHAWAVFALGAAAPMLADPRVVLDLGYQLSVAGMAALVAGRAWLARLRRAPEPPALLRTRWAAPIAREIAVGALATVATAPLVAWHFGRVSLVGIVANVAAGPLLAALQPTLFLALAFAPLGAAAEITAAAARVPIRLLDRVADTAAALPFAALDVTPTLAGVLCAGAAAVALLVAASARRAAGRALAVGAGCLALAAWRPALDALPRPGARWAELHLLDVGQGDAVALRTPRGRWILMDAGNAARGGFDAGARTVVPYVRRRGGDVALLVLSHPHADHVGGARSVLRRLRPDATWDAGFALGSTTYREVLAAARDVGSRWRRVAPGDSLVLDGVAITVLAPNSAWTAALDDPNLASVVLGVRYGRVRFLLTGDAEAEEEAWLVARARRDPAVAEALRADVLKVAHHGSRTSTTSAFLAAVRPRVALVSVGAGNSYGHPSPSVVARLASAGAEVLRTDRVGPVVVRTDGRRLDVEAAGERWTVTRDVASTGGRPPE